ncbi:FAD-linked oxidase C-terminal domain-containing protein [Candidatus Palauibacter polyketidifaciens]|uniref:FAD-binding and (Fe-S)-binding domain-containing protein n=1 Tax=Candidatus Palauibacter polyketidifaciens TaxID=3056740 RepID=UPI0023906FB1|nr:FAD-linked oxidase C-terminal domain-containing protein [Candidatus Palauibacter polyketidifaciens]MDE2719039.1 FAD-binding protein [Candidatus Palauibacter polyketidifaciens]
MTRPISHDRAGSQRPRPGLDTRREARLEARLRAGLRGEVRFDRFTRGLYSTDASIYQVEPLGVAFPESAADVRRAVELAGEHGTSVVVRGAGTSQSGQSIGRGLILDTSRGLDGVRDFDPGARRVVVEPGVVLDRLNAFLRPHGLFFPIDVATASRATLGGMAGNNSAGSRSVRYGHMVEHVRGIEAVLADGRRVEFRRDATPGAVPGDGLGADMRALYRREADELARRVPDVPRHVAGYALHRLGREGAGLSDLLVGSEGTLALFTALELDLQPIPAVRALGVCRFDGTGEALAAVPAIVALEPTAVELFDATVLGLAAQMPSFERVLRQLGEDGSGPPRDILVVEFAGDDPERVSSSLSRLESALGGTALGVTRAESPAFQARIWALRKAGLSISMSQPAARKPLAFIEDCAIPLERLPEWYRRLTEIIDRHATHAVWYAHASVGCLHVRPALDLRDGDDVERLRAIAVDAFALAGELGGSHSGEHGDGWIRSEFLEPMLGARLVSAFGEIKRRFDPEDVLNPGKIVDPPRMNEPSLLRARYGLEARKLPTALDWRAWGGFSPAVDMCNNNGTCLKRSPGVMCPSFRATSDERHSTRGRANALRLALSGQLGEDPWTSPELYEAMDLCLGCKGCRRECPTGVDMARMKVEFLHRLRAEQPLSPRDRALAYLPRYAPLVSRAAPLVNLRNRIPALARLGERVGGLAADRPLPRWSSQPFSLPSRLPAGLPARENGAPRVALFVDTFTRYFELENAHAAVRVLSRAGYRVEEAVTAGRPLCCGRTFLNAGLVEEARVELDRTVRALSRFVARGIPVVGLEPSCLLTLRDELPALDSGPEAAAVADRARLLTEWLVEAAALDGLDLAPLPVRRVRVHGHCHEKAFGADGQTLEVLRAIPDLEVEAIPAGCCGMAGSFGYEAEHAEVSRQVAELELLPTVRELRDDEWLVANGTSCRHQVADLANATGRHVVTVLSDATYPPGRVLSQSHPSSETRNIRIQV